MLVKGLMYPIIKKDIPLPCQIFFFLNAIKFLGFYIKSSSF